MDTIIIYKETHEIHRMLRDYFKDNLLRKCFFKGIKLFFSNYYDYVKDDVR